MRRIFNDNFFSFTVGFFCVLLASFALTITLDRYAPQKQGASVIEGFVVWMESR